MRCLTIMRGKVKVLFERGVLEGILQYCQDIHPREAILLLRGDLKGKKLRVGEVVFPPSAVHGMGFADFRPHMLPFDLSMVGIAHSHPSGDLRPSVFDLNHFYGRLMLIIAYPYRSEKDTAFYDRKGAVIESQVI